MDVKNKRGSLLRIRAKQKALSPLDISLDHPGRTTSADYRVYKIIVISNS